MLISGIDLKQYIESSAFCRIDTNGCLLEPRTGRIKFNFSNLGIVINLKINCQRMSGDGKVILSLNEWTQEHIISSKTSQSIEVELFDPPLEMARPRTSNGIVRIISIDVQNIAINDEEDSSLVYNWKKLVGQCGRFKCLRLVGGKLFASNGGFIEKGDNILDITTSPSNMYVRAGSNIKFIGSCEITHLQVSSAPVTRNNQPFIHRNPPTPMINSLSPTSIDLNDIPTSQRPIFGNKEPKSIDFNNIIFNSDLGSALSGFKSLSSGKLARTITSNQKQYISIKQHGLGILPVSVLKSDHNYVIALQLKRLNGNGKLKVGITNSNIPPEKMEVVLADRVFSERIITLDTTSCETNNNMHKLYFSMQDGLGEILISKIKVIDGISVRRARGRVSQLPIETTQGIVSDTVAHHLELDYPIDNPIIKQSKLFSRQISLTDVPEQFTQVNGSVFSSNLSGINWINKISALFPNISCIKNISDINLENTIVFSSVNSYMPISSIYWLRPFSCALNEDTRDKISEAKVIITSCQANFEYLKNEFQDINVKHLIRPLPWYKPKAISYLNDEKYFLYLQRSLEGSHRLVESWNPKWGKLVLVGGRGNYPDHVIPINEYYHYDKLLNIMMKSNGLIDLPIHRDYDSAWIQLAKSMSLPVISTNARVGFENLILAQDERNGIRIPTKKAIEVSMTRLLSQEIRTVIPEGHNKMLCDTIIQAFEK